MSAFSERLLALRAEKGLSQADVAGETGITTRTYQRYEAGEREPVVSTLIRIAGFYGVTADYLIGRSEKR